MVKLVYWLFAAFIAATAVLLAATLLPIPGNFQVRVVQSGSMEPAIHTGSIVVVKPEAEYGIGDIITFGDKARGAVPTTHRIVDVRTVGGEAAYRTKGDANSAPDSAEVLKKDVIGRSLFSIPYAGYAIAAARKPIGFLLLIIIPALVVAFEEITKIRKELRAIRARKSDADITL